MHKVIAALFLIGCGSKTPAPIEEAPDMARQAELPQARPEAVAPEAAVATGSAPEGAAELQTMLLAWHADDLPNREVLSKHSDAPESLRWIAQTGKTMVVRVRAMQLLALYPDAASAEILSTVAGDEAQHASLRAGAIRGLGGQDLGADETLRAVVEKSLSDDDMRVQIAAVESLTSVEASKPALEALSATAGIDARVKAAVDAAL